MAKKKLLFLLISFRFMNGLTSMNAPTLISIQLFQARLVSAAKDAARAAIDAAKAANVLFN